MLHTNTTHITWNGLYSMAFKAFYGWKIERVAQTIKLFPCLFIFFFSVSFFCRGIVVQIHTFIMTVALFCIFVCFWLGSQHNRYIPCKCKSTFWIGSFPTVFARLFHFCYHLRVYFARFHLCFLDFSHLCDVRSFDTHHFFAYLMRFPIYSAFFHTISQFIL